MFRTLFKNLKYAASGKGLDRVFMTGVSPLIVHDLTSGANVTKDITWHPKLNDLCGFRQDEISSLIAQSTAHCNFSSERLAEIKQQMRLFYNGSCFVHDFPGQDISQLPKIYNPTLCFYFLETVQQFCSYPQNMLDNNLAPDYQKLLYISLGALILVAAAVFFWLPSLIEPPQLEEPVASVQISLSKPQG